MDLKSLGSNFFGNPMVFREITWILGNGMVLIFGKSHALESWMLSEKIKENQSAEKNKERQGI